MFTELKSLRLIVSKIYLIIPPPPHSLCLTLPKNPIEFCFLSVRLNLKRNFHRVSIPTPIKKKPSNLYKNPITRSRKSQPSPSPLSNLEPLQIDGLMDQTKIQPPPPQRLDTPHNRLNCSLLFLMSC